MWGSRDKSSVKKRGNASGESEITIYGTHWCGMTQIVRRYLDKLGLSYTYLDLEEEPGAVNQLRWITGGYTNHPTVVIDGQVLIQPEVDEVQATLAENGYL